MREFPMTEQADVYRVRVMLSNTAVSSPFLNLKLVVDTLTDEVFGSGEIVRATSTGGKLQVVGITGTIMDPGGDPTVLVNLKGTAIQDGPPGEPIVIELPMTATFVIRSGWKGHGSFSFGRRVVGHCIVTPEPAAHDKAEAPKVEALVG
jgi:hypothetical protein